MRGSIDTRLELVLVTKSTVLPYKRAFSPVCLDWTVGVTYRFFYVCAEELYT
jgi:hypothetical protein